MFWQNLNQTYIMLRIFSILDQVLICPLWNLSEKNFCSDPVSFKELCREREALNEQKRWKSVSIAPEEWELLQNCLPLFVPRRAWLSERVQFDTVLLDWTIHIVTKQLRRNPDVDLDRWWTTRDDVRKKRWEEPTLKREPVIFWVTPDSRTGNKCKNRTNAVNLEVESWNMEICLLQPPDMLVCLLSTT